jgi:hypothetical protein
MVDERFDLSKKIISWKWGNNSETYSYDAEERLDRVNVGGKDEIKYVYDRTNFPKQVSFKPFFSTGGQRPTFRSIESN